MFLFFELIFALSCISFVSPAAIPVRAPTKRATVCNGHEELCQRKYSNVTYVGAHNSFGYSKEPLDLARNQELDPTTQLSLGVRMLQGQSHDKDGELHLCHTDCALLDGGKVEDYLKDVKKFLDKNPNEVITLLFTNPEGKSVKDVWKPIFDSAEITPFAYVPPQVPMKQDEWPTLGEMIESGKRVVVFLDAKADEDPVDFILPQFQMIWETPFTVTDSAFPCSVDRIKGPLATEEHMYLINHSLHKRIFGDITITNFGAAETTNGEESIMDNVGGCLPLANNRAPNFLLLDYIGKGDPFKVADKLNGFVS